MEMLPVKPERKRNWKSTQGVMVRTPPQALDEVLADYFAWEERDYQASVEAIRRGNEDVLAGRTKSAQDVHQALRRRIEAFLSRRGICCMDAGPTSTP